MEKTKNPPTLSTWKAMPADVAKNLWKDYETLSPLLPLTAWKERKPRKNPPLWTGIVIEPLNTDYQTGGPLPQDWEQLPSGKPSWGDCEN
jgi:hypothetical protein